ncbi:hypothetical protein ACI093_000124 [Cronobacter turicensis]
MKPEIKPLIYLLNTEITVEDKLKSLGFNAHHYWLNGREYFNITRTYTNVPYRYDFPDNLHESEIVIFDTQAGDVHRPADNSPLSVYYQRSPSAINFLPLDMYFATENIYSSKRRQCIIVFCGEHEDGIYNLYVDEEQSTKLKASTYHIIAKYLDISIRTGSRLEVVNGPDEREIKNCLSKYLSESHYDIVFNNLITHQDTPLLSNDAGEITGFIRRDSENKLIIFLPQIQDKEGFLAELLDKILPDHPDFSGLFPNNGSFSWISNPAYISVEERNKILDIEYEIKRHEETIQSLQHEFKDIHNKDENVKLRNLLKESGDELVFSVKWFLEYIGFENVVNPDDDVDEEAGELFEEDLNFEYEGLSFILEVKGIGGTSTDAQCSQISKIELRRRRQYPEKKFKSVYIVNHQRYKEPKARQSIPFTSEQIENAEMTYRGMTFTYELFHVYHMLEKGILRKEDVREAFKQDGVIDFRCSLKPLNFKTCFKKFNAYSFILDGTFSITKADKLAIQDKDDHWHLLSIINIQVDSIDVDEASEGSAAIQIEQLVAGAKSYYLIK